jgi:hypothetical protein
LINKRVFHDSIRRSILSDNPVPNPINITLTQKQVVDGQRIDDEISSANFRHFRNLLNSHLFGNAYKRHGRQLKMLVVREDGAWLRHHIHAILEKPSSLSIEEFIALVLDCWSKTRFGYREHHFEQPTTPDRETGWLNYILKKRTKDDLAASIDWANSTCFARR